MNHPNETLYNAGDTAIRISSDNEQSPSTPSDARVNDVTSNSHHTVNVDANTIASADSPTVQQNFLSFLHEARSHLGGRPSNHQTVANNEQVHLHQNHEREDSNINRWRVNINNALSFSAGPSTETIRSWIPRGRNYRYEPLSISPPANAAIGTPAAAASNEAAATNDVVIHFSTPSERIENNVAANLAREHRTSNVARINLSRTNSVGFATASPADVGGETSAEISIPPTNQQSTNNGTHRIPSTPPPRTPSELDEETIVYDMAVKVLSHLVRYLPFIGIVLLKSIYDHLFGILDILILHITVYQLNKSLCEQVAKMSQKSLSLLFRDYLLLTFVVVYRFMIANSRPDWFGLLINTADDPHSLGQLLYAVAVNDLILKLITIKIKILVTALPTDVIKHKPRGRLFALIEGISQMYRSLVTIKSWLFYLLISYTGLDIIVGMFFFSSLYMGAKAFEFVERFKFLKKSFCNFLRNVDYGRQPTKEEMNEAGTVCPICHDNYVTPVVLECNHIFCEVCVGTWFKREQTCPMCRAKAADDPAWQNGSTTLFYQFC